MSKHKISKVTEPVESLTVGERELVRNLRTEMPNLSLKDISLIGGVLREAACHGSVSAVSIGQKFGVSDAYADLLLRSLCAAHLMFLHGDGYASLDAGFYKPVAAFHNRVAALSRREKSRGR